MITIFLILAVFVLISGIRFFQDIQKEGLTVITDSKSYQGRQAFFEEEYAEYYSGLLTFPENNYETMNIKKYYYERDLASLDVCYKIFLEYSLGEEEFQKEKQRKNKKIICVFFQINGLEKSIITEEYMPIVDALPTECKENFNMYYFKSDDLIYGIENYDMRMK